MCLAVGLNCAMGAAELGRLTREDFLLNHQHEFQRKLKFKSTSEDSFCREFRPKTKIFGEWILWPETVKWVRWGIARAEKLGTNILFCDDDGRSLYVETAKNPQYKFANLWTDVTENSRRQMRRFPSTRLAACGTRCQTSCGKRPMMNWPVWLWHTGVGLEPTS